MTRFGVSSDEITPVVSRRFVESVLRVVFLDFDVIWTFWGKMGQI